MRDPVIVRIAELVAGQKIGALSALADKLGISQAAVSQWKKVPHTRVFQLEELTEGKVTRHEMRPDVYPTEPAPKRRQGAN